MAADGQIVFEITADGKQAIASVRDVTDAIKRESKEWGDAGSGAAGSIESSFMGMAKKVAAGLSAAKVASTLLDWGKAAVSAASDLEEVQNVVDVTFGDSASTIESWAKKAGTQFGLTETQAKKFTSTLGAMMKSAGLAGPEIVNMSTDLAGLAADMASFYNLDFETAFQKIRGGISGETEPLKQLGINMSTANLQAYALSKGITKAFDQMSQGEQTMLRYQYLMSATADAQGDFARTADGYANATRKVETAVETIKTEAGKLLLDVVGPLTTGLADMLTKLTTPVERTVLDDFNDIDVNTDTKLANIRKTAEEAGELVTILEGIENTKAAEAMQTLADDLGKIDLKQDRTKVLQDFLGELNKNVSGIAEATGKSTEEVQEWLGGIAEKANSLDPNNASGWQDLMNAITEGLPGLENTTAGQTLLSTLLGIENTKAGEAMQTLAEDLGEIDLKQDRTKVLQDFLGELNKNVTGIAEATGKSTEEVQEWLGGIAEKASSLDPEDANGWQTLMTAITEGLPGLENTKAGQDLLNTLQGIEQTKAGESVQKLSDQLDEIDLSQGKAGILKDTLAALSADIASLSAVTGKDAEGVQQWIAGVAEQANSLDENDIEGWKALSQLLKDGIPELDQTEGGKGVLSALSGEFSQIGQESGTAAAYLAALGIQTDGVTDKNQLWLETCKRLVQTLPGLASIINTETGEVKGGTQAIRDYITAWEQGQTKLAMMQAHEQKQTALDQKFAELPGLQLDMKVAEKRLRDNKTKLKALYAKYGLSAVAEEYGLMSHEAQNQLAFLADEEDNVQLIKLTDEYADLSAAVDDTTKKYNKQVDAYNEAKEALEYEEETIAEMPGVIDEATDATNAWSEAQQAAGKAGVEAMQEALSALSDYVEGVHNATEQAVNGVIKGFEKISRPSAEVDKKISDLQDKLTALGPRTKKNAEEFDKLQKQIEELGNTKISADSMKAGLEDQLKFMREYTENLRKARGLGLSDELLAELSDGSAESAEYLAALVSNPAMAKEIDAEYKLVQEEKKKFTDELTAQKLVADETYDALAAKAKETVEAIDLGEEAATAMGNTVAGIAQGINANVDGVSTAVDNILNELDRLSGWGINIDLGSFGSFNFSSGITSVVKPGVSSAGAGGVINGEFATGLDHVPFDGFLASLHEGEGILTAEENRIWQRFKNGQPTAGMDYDALGGVMRDNIRPGGDVYLNGRTVGHVISQMQGDSYRSMTRSGSQR